VSFCEYHRIKSKKIERYYFIRFDSIYLYPIFTGIQPSGIPGADAIRQFSQFSTSNRDSGMTICSSGGSRLDESTWRSVSSLTAQHAYDPRPQLEETELEILRTQELLHQLEQKRASLRRAVNHLFSAVLRLPNELSTEIILHCLPDMNLPVTANSWRTPFYFGSICHTWRDLIWSTPWIWSIVSVDLSSGMPIELLKKWFIRSDPLPLSIQLYGIPRYDWDDEYKRETLDAVASVSNRWRDIDCLWERCFAHFCAIPTPPAQLSTLSFHNRHSRAFPLEPFKMFYFPHNFATFISRDLHYRLTFFLWDN
jgi:hypothetical protein